jgi:hypothetical protein
MSSRAAGWLLAAAVLLAGCAIGPDYKRPAVAEPPTFRGQAIAEAASFADSHGGTPSRIPACRH